MRTASARETYELIAALAAALFVAGAAGLMAGFLHPGAGKLLI
jgi:hypothetical protein